MILSRAEALASGLPHYFTGKPCKYGHVAKRAAVKGVCLQCQAEWEKQNRRNNPDRVKEIRRRYHAKNRDKRNADCRKRHHENKVQRSTYRKAYYRQNIEASRKYARKHKAQFRRHYTLLQQLRQRRIRQATPSWVDKWELYAIYHFCPPGYHVDHKVPIAGKNACGLHVPWNLQYLEAAKNVAKSNRFE
jgi:hypothetical protein